MRFHPSKVALDGGAAGPLEDDDAMARGEAAWFRLSLSGWIVLAFAVGDRNRSLLR
mgnify:CR=1 FL=1